MMRHPAMQDYLDNTHAIGPDSPVDATQHLGINDLAREFLELHTLGIQAGYSPRDVTAFAAILSGRQMNTEGPSPGFVFRADMHEPGLQTVLGRGWLLPPVSATASTTCRSNLVAASARPFTRRKTDVDAR